MRFALLFIGALPLLALDGTVVNVTSGKPQAGVEINLVQPSQDGMVPLGNTMSGPKGEFKIDKQIPPGPGLIQATYQGTTYNMIITPNMPTSGVEVKVFDSTKKAGVAKTMEHLILIEPSIDNIKMSETFVLGNEGNVTYNDPAKGSIQFYLPPSTAGKAQVVVTAPGGMPITRPPLKTATADIYKIDYPLKPGETRMDVTYTVPAADKIAGKVVASDVATHLVTPPAVKLTGDGIESAGQEPTTQANIYNLAGLDYNLLIEGVGSLRPEAPAAGDASDDSGSPKVEIGPARIYSQLGWVLGLALAILAIGGVMLFRARNRVSAVALDVNGVSKYYGDFPALRKIQLNIAPGSTVALLGRNGAGKTTLLRIIAGLSKASEGTVQIGGSDVRKEATRRRIGVLGHGISLYDELSANENLILFAKLYGLDDPEKQALVWLERTGLDRVRDGLVREFSRGMRQRLAVARAFMHEPDVLLLDEPFTALDDRAIAVLQSLLNDAHAYGRTIVMSTHQLKEALELATHVALIQRGQLAFTGERTQQMVDDTGWLYRTHGEN